MTTYDLIQGSVYAAFFVAGIIFGYFFWKGFLLDD